MESEVKMRKVIGDWIGRLTLGLILLLLFIPTAAAQFEYAFCVGGFLCPVIWLVISILIMIWVYRDAEARGSSGILWLIIVFFLGIIGLIIWLVVRPPLQPQGPPPGAYPPPPGQYPPPPPPQR